MLALASAAWALAKGRHRVGGVASCASLESRPCVLRLYPGNAHGPATQSGHAVPTSCQEMGGDTPPRRQ